MALCVFFAQLCGKKRINRGEPQWIYVNNSNPPVGGYSPAPVYFDCFNKPIPIIAYQTRANGPPIMAKIIASLYREVTNEEITSKISRKLNAVNPVIPTAFLNTPPFNIMIEKKMLAICAMKNPGKVPGV